MTFDTHFMEMIYPNGIHLQWLIKMGLHETYMMSRRKIL